MDNNEVADVLYRIARILEVKEENPFKIRAYSNAARAIEGLAASVESLVREKKLREVHGVGEALEQKITELVTTGRLPYYEDLRKEFPAGLLDLMHVPFLGPKKARALFEKLGIDSLEALKKACIEDKLLTLKGFGERTQKKILDGIDFHNRHLGQYLLSDAIPVARQLLEHLGRCGHVVRSSTAGSLRRWKEVVRDVDLLASSAAPEKVMEHFVKGPGVTEVLGRGETKASVRLRSGLQVDLRVVKDSEFPCALAYFTGSKEHNVALRQIAQKKGLKVSEYGIFRGDTPLPCKDEVEFYASLGLPYFPPEMRENTGELDLPAVPPLVERKDLKGVFHVHSTWSDGTAEIEQMAEKARSLGFAYMGLSDHSKAAGYANGMDEARLAKQMREVDRLNEKWNDFTILKGLECDILPDGELDLTPQVLGELDFVIGSIHSRFDMPEGEMTDRVCKALANNNLYILGHSTGRLLLSREGYKINLERVIETARRHKKVIELNANPHRLDLDWVHCRQAKEKGVLLSINPDAHSTAALEDVEYGTAAARRGWLEPTNVLNTRGLEDVRKILAV